MAIQELVTLLRMLALLGLGIVALALPLALMAHDLWAIGPIVLTVVGGGGLGLAAVGVAGLSALWLAGDREGRDLSEVSRWMTGLGFGLVLDVQALLPRGHTAFAADSGWLSPEAVIGGAVAFVGVGLVGTVSTAWRKMRPSRS